MSDGVIVSGTAKNNLGWPVSFWIKSSINLTVPHPTITITELRVGDLTKIPKLGQWLARLVEKKANNYLQGIFLVEPLTVTTQSQVMKLSRI